MGSDRPRGRSDRSRPVRPGPNETTDVIPAIEDDELAELDELDDESFDELDEDVTGDPVADIDPDDDPEERGYRLTAAGTPDRWSVVAAWASRFGRAAAVRWAQLSASVGGGLALCLSYPPTGWWWAAFVGLALIGWVLTLRSTTRAGGLGYGFLFGLAFYIPLLPWISGLVGAMPWLALAAMEALFCGLFGLAAVVVGRLPGWPLWFAALWTTQEWLKSAVPFGGFPWGVLGFGQTNGPLLALARWGGAPLVSFAVALVGFSATLLVLEIVQWWHHGHKPGFPAPAVMLPGLSITVVLLATAVLWPQVRHSGTGAGDEQTVTVAAVQGNVPRLGLEFNAQRRAVLDNHVKETQRLADDVRAGRAPQPMFVVWPENASDIDPLANADAAAQITAAADAIGAPILVGTVTKADGYTADNPVANNTVIVWDPEHGPGERHDKKIVQPFGEYLPWRSFFKHLSSYADRAGYFVPGEGNGVVHAAGVPIGVTTCWEVIFDRAARESVLSGAQVLTVPTNNATFDENMSAQQLAFGKLRAVEHDRYLVVAGTTGISAVIAPDGRELARTDFFQPAYLDNQIRLKSDLTPATEWGPALQVVLVTLGIGALVAAILHNGGFVQRMLRRRTGEGPRR